VTLGGGTQLLAAAALVRHAGREGPLTLATTSYLAADVPDLEAAAARLDVDVTVTDPGFAVEPLARYAAGEAKEGAGMGGALALAAEAGVLDAVPGRTIDVLDRLGTGDPEGADGS
jgi:NaMN:DMB phosphoribosyltransferase